MKRWEIAIPNWHPARLNQWQGRHWSVGAGLKRVDREMVWTMAVAANVPPATGKRRVDLEIILGPRQRGGDPDAYWKSTLDALVHAGLLTDDNRQGVELGPVTYTRGRTKGTIITLEDIDDA